MKQIPPRLPDASRDMCETDAFEAAMDVKIIGFNQIN